MMRLDESNRLAWEVARVLDEFCASLAVHLWKQRELAALRTSSSSGVGGGRGRFLPAFCIATAPLFDLSRRSASSDSQRCSVLAVPNIDKFAILIREQRKLYQCEEEEVVKEVTIEDDDARVPLVTTIIIDSDGESDGRACCVILRRHSQDLIDALHTTMVSRNALVAKGRGHAV